MKIRLVWIGLVILFVSGILATSSYALLDPNTIVGVWKFDEGKGVIAKDSSQNGNDGTLANKPKWVDGKYRSCLFYLT